MPSYRYLRDIKPEDMEPEEKKEYTKKQKAGNWWHYHWGWVAGGAVLLALIVFFILEMVRQVQPDLKIGLISPYNLPDEVVTRITDGLSELVEDRNGDGKTVVQLDVYTISVAGEGTEDGGSASTGESGSDPGAGMTIEDPYTQMAGITRFSAELSLAETFVFMAEDQYMADYERQFQMLAYLDGSTPPDGATDVENMTLLWKDVPTLANLDLMIDVGDGEMVDAQELMANFRIGRRVYVGNKLEGKPEVEAEWNYAWAFLTGE